MARNAPDIVPIEDTASEPYATILAYPRPEASVLSSRIQQLRELGISELEFTGRLRVGKLSLLGKGVAGAANEIDVGPRYYDNTDDILLMEFVEGQDLPEWITTLRGKGRRLRLRKTVGDLFQQCYRMDKAGLDHGELSRAHKNVSIRASGHAVILDFESASKERSPNNLTSVTQYFFLGSGFARSVRGIAGPTDNEKLKGALRTYKSERSTDALRAVEKVLMLD